VTGGRSTTKEFTKRFLHKLTSETRHDPTDLDEPNVVYWELEAANKTDGIGDSIAVAVLLQRAKNSKFVIEMEVLAQAGMRASLLDAFHKHKVSVMGPFGPGGGSQKVPTGVDVKNLHAVSTEDVVLKQLAFVHVPEKVATVQFNATGQIKVLAFPSLSRPNKSSQLRLMLLLLLLPRLRRPAQQPHYLLVQGQLRYREN
jgi:hypothetical protein